MLLYSRQKVFFIKFCKVKFWAPYEKKINIIKRRGSGSTIDFNLTRLDLKKIREQGENRDSSLKVLRDVIILVFIYKFHRATNRNVGRGIYFNIIRQFLYFFHFFFSLPRKQATSAWKVWKNCEFPRTEVELREKRERERETQRDRQRDGETERQRERWRINNRSGAFWNIRTVYREERKGKKKV